MRITDVQTGWNEPLSGDLRKGFPYIFSPPYLCNYSSLVPMHLHITILWGPSTDSHTLLLRLCNYSSLVPIHLNITVVWGLREGVPVHIFSSFAYAITHHCRVPIVYHCRVPMHLLITVMWGPSTDSHTLLLRLCNYSSLSCACAISYHCLCGDL
jgi:hypothetical protein